MSDVDEKERDASVDQVTASPEPSVPNLTPSAEEPVTYTEDQVVKLVAERHGKLDKTIAEQRNWLALANKILSDERGAKAKLDELMSTPDEALAKVEGGVNVVEERAKLRKREQDLKAQKEAIDWEWIGRQELIQKADNMAKLVVLAEAAKEHKIPVEKLMELPCDTPELIKANARVLASLMKPNTNVSVDSGTNTGKGTMTAAQARSAFIRGDISAEEYAKTRPSDFT